MISGLNPLSIFFGNKRGRLKIENGKHLLPSFLRRDDAVEMSQHEFAKGLFHKMVLLAGQTSAQPSSAKKDDDVVDADFEEVKDDKK